ncbi:hypothetical protein COCON_G00166910 [Conger conger]|uniref:PA domain-containing protein n=1 Tax=Conger conger TaxID=82655 RepID=A0A9Q1D7A7_CONCO|nr:hypothetical protein COCON_G00166910 [Conger conger]
MDSSGPKGVYRVKLIAEVSQTTEEEEVLPLIVQVISPPFLGRIVLTAGPAKFGMDLTKQENGVKGSIVKSAPYSACGPIENPAELRGGIALALRGDCMFAAKARRLQGAGAIGVIFVDHKEGSSSEATPLFQMVGDGGPTSDITVPLEHRHVEVLLLPKEKPPEKPIGMNIQIHLAKEGEVQARQGKGTTIQLLLQPGDEDDEEEEPEAGGNLPTGGHCVSTATEEQAPLPQPCADAQTPPPTPDPSPADPESDP